MARGKKFLDHKEYDRAMIEFRNAAQAQPKDAEARYQLGVAALGGGKIEQAVLAFREATTLNPKHSQAQLKLSELMVRARRPDIVEDAVKRLDQVLTTEPDSPEALDTLALAELRLGRSDDAVKHLQQVLSKFPGDLKSEATMAGLQYSKGDFAGAEESLKSAVARAPKSVEAAIALANLYILEKKNFAAEGELQRALKLDNSNVVVLLTLGNLQSLGGRNADADQTYTKLASLPKANLSYIHAAFLFREGKNQEAVLELEKLAKAAPSDRGAQQRVAAAYVRVGRLSDALNRLNEVLKKAPNNPDALLLRSRLYLNAGRPLDAEKDIQAVLRLQADSADAHYALARVNGYLGRETRRREELNETIRLNPQQLNARIELAKLELAAGHAQAALALMDGTPEAQKNSLTTLTARNWALLASNNQTEAAKSIDRALAAQRTPELLLQRGILKATKGDYAGGRADGEEALKLNPNDPAAVNFVAETFVAQKQNQAAINFLHDAEHNNPKSPQMQTRVGQWFERLGEPDQARTALNAARALSSTYTPADLELAALDITEGKIDSARTTLNTVIKQQPQNERAHLMLATAEYNARNKQAALAQFRSVLDLNPDDVPAVNAVAYLMASSNPEEALKYAEHAMELAPSDPSVQDTIGWVYYQKRVYGKAVEYLAMSVAKDPSAVHQFHLAMSYMKSGDQARGQASLAKAVAKDPNVTKTETEW